MEAYIDGSEVPILRANYLLRALKIPSGSHEIVFEFKPKSYFMGEQISLISSLVLILALFLYGFLRLRKPQLLNE